MIDQSTRIIDLTVGDLLEIIGKTPTVETSHMPTPEKRFVYGINGIAKLFDCSKTTASRIKASGKIDGAVLQLGRKIIVDADLALELIKDNNL
jgi:hypothetical protein